MKKRLFASGIFLLFVALIVSGSISCGGGDWERNLLLEQNQRLKEEKVELVKEKEGLQNRYDRLAKQVEALELADSGDVSEQVQRVIVDVEVVFSGNVADIDRILDIPSPPGVDDNEKVEFKWFIIGTVVYTGIGVPQVVVARHALFHKVENKADLINFLRISVIDEQANSQYDIPITGLREFRDLDLVAFDAPIELQGQVSFIYTSWDSLELQRPSFVPPRETVSHVFRSWDSRSEKWQIRKKSASVLPIHSEDGVDFGEISSKDLIRLTGRFEPGDSGSPVIFQKDGVTYLRGIVIRKYIESHEGIAITSRKLYEKLVELQRSQ